MKQWLKPVTGYERTALDREINIQKVLNHPNCIRLYGTSKTPDGRPVLILEKADGCLTDYTTKPTCPRLTNQQKCQIILEIAKGLAYIHSLGCVHRDIKVGQPWRSDE